MLSYLPRREGDTELSETKTSTWFYGTAIELEQSRLESESDEGASMIRRYLANIRDPGLARLCTPIQKVGELCNVEDIGSDSRKPLICVRSAVVERYTPDPPTWVVEVEYKTLPFFGKVSMHIERAEIEVPYWIKWQMSEPQGSGVAEPRWEQQAWTYPTYRITLEGTVNMPVPPGGGDAWGIEEIIAVAKQSNQFHKLPLYSQVPVGGLGRYGTIPPNVLKQVTGPNWWFIGADVTPISKAQGVQVTYSWTFESGVDAMVLTDLFGINPETGEPNPVPSQFTTSTPDPRGNIPFTDPPQPYPPIRTNNIILCPKRGPWERFVPLPDNPTATPAKPLPTIDAIDPYAKRRNNASNPNGIGWLLLPGIT